MGLFQRGYVYIQNASSLVPVLALDPRPGEAILDVSAAPGGKAAHIASVVGGEAELWLNDAISSRVARLREVVRTHRVKAAQITSFPAQYVDKFVERRFDRLLLDAQCTGEGRVDLRRPSALQFWSTKRINEYSRLQQRMLMASFKLLEPGGVLVYSTCTIAPEENEAPVSHLLEHRPEASLEPIGVEVPEARHALREWGERRFHPAIENAVRVYPTAARIESWRERLSLDANRRWLALHVSAREAERRWPAAHCAQLIRRLANADTGVLLLWSPGAADHPAHPGDDD